jgi:Mg/Co/Ni transporter MgtE
MRSGHGTSIGTDRREPRVKRVEYRTEGTDERDGLGEMRLRDWWKVLGRELVTGLGLGLIDWCSGLLRCILGSARGEDMTQYWFRVGLTIGCSLVGVVVWGSLVGAMLPFILQKVGLGPAPPAPRS